MRFSEYFNINKTQFELDFLNIDLENDLPLFVDPWLIKIENSDFSIQTQQIIQSFFSDLIDKIKRNDKESALDLLRHLHEPVETHLGYSRKGHNGSAIGDKLSNDIYSALSESKAVKTGFIKDIEDTALLIEGISKDKISDLVTNIIRKKLIDYTNEQCTLFGIPMSPVASGFYWDEESSAWTRASSINLPIYGDKKIILVPKSILSINLAIDAKDFYEKEVVIFEQTQHLDARTGLCRIVKGTLKPPFKKYVKKSRPFSKDVVYDFVKQNPDKLTDYKKKKGLVQKIGVTDWQIIKVNGESLSLNRAISKIIVELKAVSPGKNHADAYHNIMIGVVELLFSNQISDLKKEYPINSGRKRIDLSATNISIKGFFFDVTKLAIPCRKIYFECKNYSKDISNPELDQLNGRFSKYNARLGFVFCRSTEDKEMLRQRCRDFVIQHGNYLIILTDHDLISLLEMKSLGDEDGLNKFLNSKLDEISP